ncbi:hypothetical protein Pmani_004349 [Petrolisthes manimaculis]|uniref:BZIP domain-containing protein n=1 Tax=Petrolisthes manimaculis TaxID=1843537 RepID=A0AAE1UHL2_9EUCA|nr:hypothetical protein Pmani_004349 [Petrolisthes manimaculis]
MWQEEKRRFELPKHDIDLSTRSSSPTKKNTMPSCTVPKKRNYFGRTETSLIQDTVNLKLESSYVSSEPPYSSFSSSPPLLIDAQQQQQQPQPQPRTGIYYSNLPISSLTSYGSEVECNTMDVEDCTSYYNPPPSSVPKDIESTLAGFGLKMINDGNNIMIQDVDVKDELERYGHGAAYNCLSPASNNSGSTDDSLSPSPSVCVSPPPPSGGDSSYYIVQQATTRKKVKDGTKKKKMFEMGPICDDTEMEKRRLNAINAKNNRDKKKQELGEHRRKIESLEEINQRCTQALKMTYSNYQEQRYEVERQAASLLVKEREILLKNREIKKKREEMVLLKGHLEIISGSLDDHNPAKNLIGSLLKNLSSAHEACYS